MSVAGYQPIHIIDSYIRSSSQTGRCEGVVSTAGFDSRCRDIRGLFSYIRYILKQPELDSYRFLLQSSQLLFI